MNFLLHVTDENVLALESVENVIFTVQSQNV